MAFKVSNKAFEEAFSKDNELSVVNSASEVVYKMIEHLKKYLSSQQKYPSAKAISRWLEKGGSLSSFSCRGDMVEMMMVSMRNERIPFILVQEATGSKGFFIRSKDNEKQKKIARRLLKGSASYCQVTSGKEAGSVYLQKNIPHHGMIAIGNVTKDQLVYLEEVCNKILPGETIGVDKMEDGTYLVSVHGETAIMGSKYIKGRTFASALSEVMFLFNANVKKEMIEESKNTNAFRRAKVRGFLDEDGGTQKPVWVVGSENYFVKRTIRGFERGHAEEMGDEIILESDLRVAFDDPAYEKRLNSALAKITSKKVLYRLEDVLEHFRSKKKKQKNSQIKGEQHLMEEVNLSVANKVRRDAVFVRGNNWAQKLKHYQVEVSKVLTGVRDGKVPQGYAKEEISNMMDIAYRYKLDMHMASPAIDKLRDIEVFERPVGPPKIKNIEQEIARYTQQVRDQDLGRTEPGRGEDR